MSFQDGQDAAFAAFGIKEALHALDRLQERTNLDPNVISMLQAQADTLDLPEGHYYMPLKSPEGNHAGYAAFKTVPAWPKPKLVLATVLGPEMHPKGSNIAHLMNASHSQDTAYQAPDLTKAADFLTDPDEILRQARETRERTMPLIERERQELLKRYGFSAAHPAGSMMRGLNLPGELSDIDFNIPTEDIPTESKRLESLGLPYAETHPAGFAIHRYHIPEGMKVDVKLMRPDRVDFINKNLNKFTELSDAERNNMILEKYKLKSSGNEDAYEQWKHDVYTRMGVLPPSEKKADFDTDAYNAELSPQQRAALRRRFDYFTRTLRRRGVETGTAHKRIVIPKGKLTENDILGLGFEPVTIAIPEAGQDQFSSYRHPDNTFHIHSHPEGWTMHEDRHPASTMIAKHEPTVLGKAKALVQGMPHLVTEGIPGLGYYLKGQLGGTQSTAQNILEDINPEVRRRLERLKPSPTYEEKAAMDKTAYGDGQQAALSQYGVAPEGWTPEDEQGQEEQAQPLIRRRPQPPPAPKSHTSWLPAALAATVAGAGMYKYMRTPKFAPNNPYLKGIQQRAVDKGFHHIVDVSHTPNEFEWNHDLKGVGGFFQNAGEWVNEAMAPKVNLQGELTPWNKFKLWALYGGEAIPVASRPGGKHDDVFIPGHEGPMNVKGVTFNRHGTPEHSTHTPFRSVVHGGMDLEGSPETMRRMHAIDVGGKAKEFQYWNKHDPGFMPETQGDLSKYLPPNHQELMKTPQGRVQIVRAMRRNMRKGFGTKGDDTDFLLKPDLGLQSAGNLPFGHEDWGQQLNDYYRHMKDPANLAAYNKEKAISDVAGIDYLKNNGLLQGQTLDHMLKNPKRHAILQRTIPNYNEAHEYRIHVINGEVPKYLITPRHEFETGGNIAHNFFGVPGLGDVDYERLQAIAKEHVSKLPAAEQKGMFGLDVHYDPETGAAHLIESNPTQVAGMYGKQYVTGGGSGFLDPHTIPWAGHALYRHATGRHTTPVAGAAALGAAGAAGLGARLLTPETKDDENQDVPHPAG